MNADHRGFKYKGLSQQVIGIFYVYNELGHGFLESVYEKSLSIAIAERGLVVKTQIQIPVTFRGHRVGDFVADMLVQDVLLGELKAARTLDSSHEAPLLNYLRATDIEVGLLLNFGLKPEFKRLAYDNQRKQIRVNPRLSAAVLLSDD